MDSQSTGGLDTGEPAPASAESDRDATGVSLATVAETDAANATSCRIWREQAIGLRESYRKLQGASK